MPSPLCARRRRASRRCSEGDARPCSRSARVAREICRFVLPLATSNSTSSSRGLSRPGGEDGEDGVSEVLGACRIDRRAQPHKRRARGVELPVRRFLITEHAAGEGERHPRACNLVRSIKLLPATARGAERLEGVTRISSRERQRTLRVRRRGAQEEGTDVIAQWPPVRSRRRRLRRDRRPRS